MRKQPSKSERADRTTSNLKLDAPMTKLNIVPIRYGNIAGSKIKISPEGKGAGVVNPLHHLNNDERLIRRVKCQPISNKQGCQDQGVKTQVKGKRSHWRTG